jgi:hypothetical protein
MKPQPITDDMAWAIVSYNAMTKNSFKSVQGILYELRIEPEKLFYRGGERNNGEEEKIDKADFVLAFEKVMNAEIDINTNSIKEFVPNSMYRKRTPFIGLLHTAKIIK